MTLTVTGARVRHRPEKFQGLGAGRGAGGRGPAKPTGQSGGGGAPELCRLPACSLAPPPSPPSAPCRLFCWGSQWGLERTWGDPCRWHRGWVVTVTDGGALVPCQQPPQPHRLAGFSWFGSVFVFLGPQQSCRTGALKWCHPTTLPPPPAVPALSGGLSSWRERCRLLPGGAPHHSPRVRPRCVSVSNSPLVTSFSLSHPFKDPTAALGSGLSG